MPGLRPQKIQPEKADKEIMFLESVSKYDFDETVKLLQSEIEKANWKLVSVNDLQQTLKAAGKDVLPVKVFFSLPPKTFRLKFWRMTTKESFHV